MKAHVHSVRIAPKKANLIAKMVRGLAVPDAIEALRRTHKKGARIVETLLRSAVANASHNDRQDPQTMVIKTIVVNQGTALRRGMPKARGQVRPYRKFLSHITVTLGFPEEKSTKKTMKTKNTKSGKDTGESASQTTKTAVKESQRKTKKDTSSSSSISSSSSSSSN